MRQLVQPIARQSLHFINFFNLVPEKLQTNRHFGIRRRENFQRISANTERRTFEIGIVSGILQFYQLPHQLVAFPFHTRAQRQRQTEIFLRRAQPVNAGHRSHDDNVFSFHQRPRCAVAQLVNLVVHAQIFFNVSVRGRNVAFRLIIIVIGYEIFHAVFRKKFPKLITKLRSKRFVMRDDKRRAVDVFDDVCHRESLTAARYPHQNLRADTVQNPFRQFFYRLRLIPRRRIRRV